MAAELLLHDAAAAWLAARHGEKRPIVEALARSLGVSVATAHRRLSALTAHVAPRKRRSDAGKLALTRDEALRIAALVEETRRLTGTGTLPVEQAVDILRKDGRIDAARMDEATGELHFLSTSSICRALRHYHLHKEQLLAPTPAARLASRHPNHLWQIDASVSRQFYLADDGTQVMAKAEFYRGKPKNFTRIADRRLWRYCITDHASGCIEVFYVQGAESSSNLLASLMYAMTQRPTGTMHGIPRLLMMDPGSAVTAGTTRNFIASCGIDLIVNEVGNARAKGQVENANYIVETHFEAMLKLRAPVTSLEEINREAQQWAHHFNATREHSRHGMTRRDAWLLITPEQLVLAPTIEVMRALANSAPKPCTVRDGMVRYRGGQYDVRDVPGLINGQRVQVVANAMDTDGSVRVLLPGEDNNRPVHYIAPRIAYMAGPWKFLATAAMVGEEFKSLPETPADAARKELERVAMEVRTDAEAAAARKAKRLAFGGKVDPMKHIRDANARIPEALPRAGTPSQIEAPVIAERRIEPAPIRAELPPLNHVEAAMRLKPLVERAGQAWTADMYARTAQRWPEGLPIDDVEDWAATLATQARGGLRIIGGGAA